MPTVEELLAKARKPAQDAMKLHPYYRGKIETYPRCAVRNMDDFSIWYTPGVAEPCRAIQKDVEKVYEYTWKWNVVAVVSDGTRVLGLGDIGPEAAMPVMEGKSLIFKYLGGVDAVPICLRTKDPDEIIRTVKLLEPSFGGINLEDLSQPKCFRILETLRREMEIPVWHDDQQGTAAVTLAGLLGALKVVGKKLEDARIAMIGAGAANIACARIIIGAGADPERIVMCDSTGILHKGRTELKETHQEKWELALKTNGEGRTGGIPEAMKGMDATVALAKPGPGTIKPEWVKAMASDAVVLTMANPVPEIWPWEAKEAGAAVVATGRSDFPNQVNNSLGFPSIFRGALDVRARTITDEMCIEAARELARYAEDKGLREDYIIPTMEEWEVYPRVAAAVGTKAVEQGVARINLSREELLARAEEMIRKARSSTALLMREGVIPPVPAGL
ncbi:MAG TPA: NADP-dependent malic enzyme [Firmicutes bacterium]|nr:NADP-dependent malic enzyme [Bacillota bacterium]